jgi:hypothetical protein
MIAGWLKNRNSVELDGAPELGLIDPKNPDKAVFEALNRDFATNGHGKAAGCSSGHPAAVVRLLRGHAVTTICFTRIDDSIVRVGDKVKALAAVQKPYGILESKFSDQVFGSLAQLSEAIDEMLSMGRIDYNGIHISTWAKLNQSMSAKENQGDTW